MCESMCLCMSLSVCVSLNFSDAAKYLEHICTVGQTKFKFWCYGDTSCLVASTMSHLASGLLDKVFHTYLQLPPIKSFGENGCRKRHSTHN